MAFKNSQSSKIKGQKRAVILTKGSVSAAKSQL